MKASRREFIRKAGLFGSGFIVALKAGAWVSRLSSRVRIGLIADLHHDIMHDGLMRMKAFSEGMKEAEPDAIIQLGDFAYPNPGNRAVIDLFNNCNPNSLHVIGNHDTDNGHTKDQCIDNWGMKGRYYEQDINGIKILVLDGNDKGSPDHKGGYPSFIGKEQLNWLEDKLDNTGMPVLLASHQPLAGPYAVDNAPKLQALLGRHSEKVILSVNGHSHIDSLIKIDGVPYLHINSASYQWVGGDFKHDSYSSELHEKFPWISYTCPYRDPLFALLEIDAASGIISVIGKKSIWVGKSPAQLGKKWDGVVENGVEVVPEIRDRDEL